MFSNLVQPLRTHTQKNTAIASAPAPRPRPARQASAASGPSRRAAASPASSPAGSPSLGPNSTIPCGPFFRVLTKRRSFSASRSTACLTTPRPRWRSTGRRTRRSGTRRSSGRSRGCTRRRGGRRRMTWPPRRRPRSRVIMAPKPRLPLLPAAAAVVGADGEATCGVGAWAGSSTLLPLEELEALAAPLPRAARQAAAAAAPAAEGAGLAGATTTGTPPRIPPTAA